MELTAKLAGFFGAQALWSAAKGEQVIPILGFSREQGVRDMTRLEDDRLEKAVENGMAWLKENPDGVQAAVLIYDGYLTTAEGRRDAILIEGRDYEADGTFAMAIPYQPAEGEAAFSVHKPAFVDLPDAESQVQTLSEAFFRGVNENPPAARVWKAHLAEA